MQVVRDIVHVEYSYIYRAFHAMRVLEGRNKKERRNKGNQKTRGYITTTERMKNKRQMIFPTSVTWSS